MKITKLLIIVSVLALQGCDDVEKMLTFHINDRTSIRIEKSLAVIDLPLEIPTPAVTSNSQQQYENNNTRADLVKEVKLDQLKLTITSPEGKHFSFLKTIRIFISAPDQDKIELASLDDVPPTASVIELAPTAQQLDAYARSSSYDLHTEVTTDETLTEDVDIQVDLRFRVTADTF